ncbi:nucleotidyltransferase family protein [Sphingomonas sp. SUN019]|uniref:nucleotidyltransferase domain-containing protein n=1 Tax=Sphingomonas sp. SUN019 TaxID=2937788 RepID=UPI002164A6A0|nr:nucleotidyltransferase family protein [Sphingomonas sp. SUN019]UVO52099.1 nucleotidyltransferase family protein [Sphingomonas sp. SUN019]
MSDATLLVRTLTDPGTCLTLDPAGWAELLTMARAEQLIGSLAHRLNGLAVPPRAAAILEDARADAAEGRRHALWEAEMARRALTPLGCPVVLLKGTAFVAAGLDAGQGRSIGDLDILVPRASLDAVEAALLAAGWEWVKPDPYDDDYYRRWMHELPPLIHRERDWMIDVHHTILPPTARITPDPAKLLAAAEPLEGGLSILSQEDMVVHAAIHLFADGDLSGGLRNLWDIDRLLREFSDRDDSFWLKLAARAAEHEAGAVVARAARQANDLYGTPIPDDWRQRDALDPLIRRRLLARDGWGRAIWPVTRLGFYVRSHWMRMPPAMLARHLWIKARRRDGS